MSNFNDDYMGMPGKLPKQEIDFLIRKTYEKLIEDIPKTLKNFVIFADEESVIEVPAGGGDRTKIVEVVLAYFNEAEEYDKCERLNHLITLLEGD